MTKVLIIILAIFLGHILCGLICAIHWLSGYKSFSWVDFLLLSILGPIIIIIWVGGEIYCWIVAKINKINERRRIKRNS
jgi:hypothetical protein